eukprot:sb/3474233/
MPHQNRTMLYKRYIEIGRVCFIRLGDDIGKSAVVVDLVDQKHLMVDGPGGLGRKVVRLNQVALTDIKINIPRGCKTKTVRTAMAKEGVEAKLAATSLVKKFAAKNAKAQLGDFARFKNRVAKTASNRKIRSTVRKLKKSS